MVAPSCGAALSTDFEIERSADGTVDVGVGVGFPPRNWFSTMSCRTGRLAVRKISPSAFVFRDPSLDGSLSNNCGLYGKKFAVLDAPTVSWSLYFGAAHCDVVARDSCA